ncbi:MAG: BBP7 family outer membrane beta-barrel protein [Planctomycetes bacterium]|nr:BBP7 family outer membrane beta-barrel protein [Planctomycetota bacterium]
MASHRWRSVAALIAAFWMIGILSPAESLAQSRRHYAGDGPNKASYTDVAVGQMVDALFAPDLSNKAPARQARRQKKPRFHQPSASRSGLRGTLVNNPDTSDGNSEFALVDRYGGVLRYVEPVDDIDLEAHVGETVAVRHDTGDMLLASQLDFLLSPAANGGVQLAAYEEELIEPGMEEGSIIMPGPEDALYLDAGIDFGGCPRCGGTSCQRRNGCSPGARGILYARAEYLIWWLDGMHIPRLVVEGVAAQNPDPNGPSPIFDEAVIVYGNQEILDDDRDGFRIRLGMWLDDCGQWAVEGDYFGFDTVSSTFTDGGDGVTRPFVGRPFIDATTGLDAVEDVSFPGIEGFVTIVARSNFESAGLRLRHNICCVSGSRGCGFGVGGCGSGIGCGSGVCGGGRGTQRIDFLFGLRYTNLDESLIITEDLETTDPNQIEIDGQDRFFTNNEFIGGELGFLWEWECRRWSVELLSLLAIGNNRQSVDISGFTNQDEGAGIETKPGLLLTQTTNIGSYSRNEFSVIPQIGATVGFQLTPRFRLTGGYTLMYWGNVVRPGDQIDLHVNPALLAFPPPANPVPARPAFAFNETDLWAQGINIGGEYRW